MPKTLLGLEDFPGGDLVSGRKKVKKRVRAALLGVSLSWLGGCTEIRTFVEMSPSDLNISTVDSPCVVITKGQPLQQVKACDHERHLEIIAPSWVRTYKKTDIQRAVTDLFMQFATNPELGPHGLTGAGADVWIDVDLMDPNNVRFAVLFRTKPGLVLVREPLDLMLWEVNRESLVFIPEFNYPSRKARKIGMIQVVPHNDVTMAQLKELFDTFEGQSSTRSFNVEGTWPYLMLKTTPFSEEGLIRRLARFPRAKDLIEDLIFVPAGEREGAKYRLMSLDLLSPAYGLR